MLKTGSGSIGTILSWVIVTKIIAAVNGSTGVGLFSILRQTNLTVFGLLTLQGTIAFVQGLASRRGDEDKARYQVSVASLYVLSGLGGALTLWIAAPWLSVTLLSRRDLTGIYLIRGLIGPVLFSIGTTYFGAILNSYHALGRLALGQLLGAAAGAVVAFPLLTLLGGQSGLLAILWITTSASLVASAIFVWRAGWLAPLCANWKMVWHAPSVRHFLNFSMVMTAAGFTTTGTLLLLRTFFVHYGGLQQAGFFDAAWTISYAYLTIALTSVGTYLLPALAHTDDAQTRSILIANVLRVVTFVVVPMTATVIVFKPWIISLLYTRQFFPCLNIMVWFLLGDYLKASSWVFGTAMQAFADLRAYFWSEIISDASLAAGTAVSLFVFHRVGGVGVCYLVLYAAYLVFCFVHLGRSFHLRIPPRQIRVWAAGYLILVVLGAVSWTSTEVRLTDIVLLITLVGGYLWASTRAPERRMAIEWVKGQLPHARTT